MSFSFSRTDCGFDRALFDEAAAYLKEHSVPFYGSSLKELALFFLECDSLTTLLLTGRAVPSSPEALGKLENAVSRLADGEPPQYITGIAPFFGHDFIVNENVLIPRFDTELSVEIALSLLKNGDKIADLCSGSGCIGLSVACEMPVLLTAVDISEGAGEIFARNREKLLSSIPYYKDRPPRFLLCDLLSSGAEEKTGRGYDMVLSNPPYISLPEMKNLTPDVLHEPELALFGGEDGLDFYRVLTPLAARILRKEGYLLFEVGQGQAEAVMHMMKENGFTSLRSEKDAGGIERVVIGQNTKG